MQRITPCLWFDNQGEDAANYYVSLFDDAKILEVSRYGEGAPMPAGTALTVSFQLEGLEFTALNGGPVFTFNEAVSFQVSWSRRARSTGSGTSSPPMVARRATAAGSRTSSGCPGRSSRPAPKLLSDPDPGRAQRAMQCMLQQNKIDIEAIRKAADDA